MIWKTETHEFTATVCQRTGKPCPALARMARVMAQAMAQAANVTTEAFEIEGDSTLTHCPEGCMARFRAQQDQIRVYCGADPETGMNLLDNYADMIFGLEFSAMASGTICKPPCALLEATVLTPPAAAQEPQHVPA